MKTRSKTPQPPNPGLTRKQASDLAKYVNVEAAVADKNAKEWGASGDQVNSAYRSGMWYAYNDIRNHLPPA